MKKLIALFFVIKLVFVYSQNQIGLEQCIEMALKNKTHFLSENYDLNKNLQKQQFDKLSFLPNLSVSTGLNYNFGRKLDAFTNTFATNTVQSTNLGLSTYMPIFNGFKYVYQKKYNILLLSKNKLTINSKEETVKLDVIGKYLELLKLKYSIENQSIVISNLQVFKSRQAKLLSNGKLSKIDTLQTQTQILNEKMKLTQLQRDYESKLFRLNFTCALPFEQKNDIKVLVEIAPNCKVKLKELSELEVLSLDEQMEVLSGKLGKSTYLPSFNLNGNFNTGFSTNNKDFTLPGTPVKPFRDQIDQNRYQSIGVSLSVPIFSKGELIKAKKSALLSAEYYTKTKELKQQELSLRKLEIEQKKISIQETIKLSEEILKQKEEIYKLNENLYFEGKINIIDLEKFQNELNDYRNSLINLRLDLLLNDVYEY